MITVLLWSALMILPSGIASASAKPISRNAKELADDKALFQEIEDQWENDYFHEAVVSPGDTIVEVDGEDQEFSEAFDVSEKAAQKITQTGKKAQEWISSQEDHLYEVNKDTQGDLHVSAPYQTRRILVDGILAQDYGAQSIYRDQELEQTVLQFATEEEAKEACDKINAVLPDKACPDVLVTGEKTSKKAVSKSISISWGTTYMGLDVLKTNIPDAYANNKVTVAIVDSGYNPVSEMTAGRKISPASKAFYGNSANLQDLYGHGCHVTGIIADATPANVELMILKVSDSKGEATLEPINKAMAYALNHGADVLNYSMGTDTLTLGKRKLNYLNKVIDKAYNKGIPVVAAAGNKNHNVKYEYPANYSKTFATSAINENASKAQYSNYGSMIDFTAPGSNIISAAKTGRISLMSLSGTSMATPYITAAAAVMKMMQPNLSVYGIYRELKRYSRDLGASGKDNYYGWGMPVVGNLYNNGIYNYRYIVTNPGKTRLTKAMNGPKGIVLKWRKKAGTEAYLIYRKTGKGAYKHLKTVYGENTLTCIDRRVRQGKKYYYKIATYKLGMYGSLSSSSRKIMRLGKVKAYAKNNRKRAVTVSWKKKKYTTWYQVQYSTSPKFKKKKTITVSAKKRSVLIKGFKRKKTYYFRVRSKNKNGSVRTLGAWSTVKKVRIR